MRSASEIGQAQAVGNGLRLVLPAYGAYTGLTDGVGKAWVSQLAEEDIRGKAQGTFKMFQTFGVLIAGTWAGLVWKAGDGHGSLALIFAGVLAGFGGGIVTLLIKSRWLSDTQ